MEYNEIVTFLWEKQEFLRSHYKRNKYGSVILPFVILARLDAELQPTKSKVLKRIRDLVKKGIKIGPGMDDELNRITNKKFNNKSEFESLNDLLSEQKDIKINLVDYVNGFSANIQDIFDKFKFSEVIEGLEKKNLLWKAVEHFARYTKDLAKIDNHNMGTIYEELIRRANEASHETAGDHFTPRDVIKLMVALILSPEENEIIKNPNRIRVIYDPACGTGGMLSEAVKYLEGVSDKLNLGLVGQDINEEAYAMCKSDMMIRGVDPEYVQNGNSLTDEDHFKDFKFDYMLSNPPYGKDWKDFADKIQKEFDEKEGRYDAGLPRKSDGSLLFLQHMISKMHPKSSNKVSRIAVVFNGSPLFTGEAGTGESEIRKWLFENDYLETIIALPKDLFYNTGIYTYIWILTNIKSDKRKGKVQFINAIEMYDKLKKSLGNKRNEIKRFIDGIVELYESFPDQSEKCKVFENNEFAYTRIKVNRPLRRNYRFSADRIEKVKQKAAFIKLAESTKKGPAQLQEEKEGQKLQEKIIKTLQKQENSRIFNDYLKFETELKRILIEENIPVQKSILTDIINALSELDESAPISKNKQGRVIFDPELVTYENVPFSENIPNHFKGQVLKYASDAEYDPEDNTVGYEIPITKYFYKYKPMRSLQQIDSEIKETESKIMRELQQVINS